MNNLHIIASEFKNASRVLKQTKSLVNSEVVDNVYIAALHLEGLEKEVNYGDKRELKRFSLRSRKLSKFFLVQLIKYVEFCISIYFHYKNKNVGMVNIHNLSMLPLGVLLKYRYNAILIYDAHELEAERNGLIGVRKKISKWIEKTLIKYVDMTIVVSESIADWYEEKYDIQRPVVVLNSPKKRVINKKNIFREELSIRDDQKILIYQGGLFHGRGINLILDAFKSRIADGIVVVFMGYGGLEKEIKDAAAQYPNIFFFPAVNPDVVLEYTSSADVGLSLIENTCLSYYYCMPNKLFEYSMVGLPVLVSNMKDMSEMVISNNMGVVVDNYTSIAINKAIDTFLNKDLDVMKENAYRAACENSWEVQEKKMLNAYHVLLKYKV
ncbi:glycosyltransferase [Acinetobacter pseudolwoffii]|uniref:glycosyltransferase n=1 Tax=Acinetobacter pseudolwoffii TaxID=2053287 RepID=UPI0035253880